MRIQLCLQTFLCISDEYSAEGVCLNVPAFFPYLLNLLLQEPCLQDLVVVDGGVFIFCIEVNLQQKVGLESHRHKSCSGGKNAVDEECT